MHRFFVDPETIATDFVTLTGNQAAQIARVLRLKAGEQIGILDGLGSEFVVELRSVQPSTVIGAIVATEDPQTEPALSITLVQSLLKAEKFEWVLQKGTELGISSFIPVWTERSIVPLKAAAGKTARWSAIIQEAAEQSHRTRLPTLAQPATLSTVLKNQEGPTLIFWEEEHQRGLRTALDQLASPVTSVTIVVGPEGGFSSHEAETAVAMGAIPVSLGPRILRAETAGVVAASAILYHFHELGG